MLSSYELRLRARASLGGSIFGNIWLLSVLALVIVSAVTSLVSFTFVGPLLVIGSLSLGMASIFLRLARGKGAVDLTDLMKGFAIDYVGNLLLGILSRLYIFLWSLLLFIPGIMKAYAYSMIYFVFPATPAASNKIKQTSPFYGKIGARKNEENAKNPCTCRENGEGQACTNAARVSCQCWIRPQCLAQSRWIQKTNG